jgi:hypothetical protein
MDSMVQGTSYSPSEKSKQPHFALLSLSLLGVSFLGESLSLGVESLSLGVSLVERACPLEGLQSAFKGLVARICSGRRGVKARETED